MTGVPVALRLKMISSPSSNAGAAGQRAVRLLDRGEFVPVRFIRTIARVQMNNPS
jgi:hypothetical protein